MPLFCLIISILILLLSTSRTCAQGFVDISNVVGLSNTQAATFGQPVWTDFNNDGHLDVFNINHGDDPVLLENNGGLSFTDIMATTGIALTPGGDRHGAAWGDYDNDGDKDLFITLGGGGLDGSKNNPDQLYRNDGEGNFTDVALEAGVSNVYGRGRSVNWIDFNHDGFLDIFLNNMNSDNLLLKNNGDGTFTDVAVAAGINDDVGTKASWSDYDKDGDLDFFTTGSRDQLWQNNGDGIFSDVTSAAGIRDDANGQSISWGDFNNDGYNDLFITRGYDDIKHFTLAESNVLAFNTNIKPLDLQLEAGIDFSTNGQELTFDLYISNCRDVNAVFLGVDSTVPVTMPFTVTANDVRNKPDFVSGEDFGFFIWRDTSGWHIRWSHDGKGNSPVYYGKITTPGRFSNLEYVNVPNNKLAVINTLYLNNGDGTFTDVTAAAGVQGGSNNRGAVWGDYDNDGDLDLYVVNSGNFLGNGNNLLYKNFGNGTFRNVARAMGVQGLVDGRGDGVNLGDYNNDGSLDFYVTNGAYNPVISQTTTNDCLVHGPHVLYENIEKDKQWLKLTLLGTISNRDGIGAKIQLKHGSKMQYRENNGGSSFFSQGSGPLHFGLNANAVIDELIVEWPSGIIQTLTNISANQHLTIEEQSNP